MSLFETKTYALALVAVATLGLSACGSMPSCNDELDECNYGGPYTEERTVEAGKRMPAPIMEPTPMPEPEPAPAPEPEPVVDDTPVMQSAEPQFTTISK